MAPSLAELGHEAEHLRIGEGIVLSDSDDLLVTLLVEGVSAKPRHPLRAIGGEAEEVGCRIPEGCVLRGRGTVDEGHIGLRLGIVLDRQALIARQGTDHDREPILLDELAGGAHRAVGRSIGRAGDELDLLAARHVVVLLERELDASHAVLAEHGEGSLERGERADLDRVFGAHSACGKHKSRTANGGQGTSSGHCHLHFLPMSGPAFDEPVATIKAIMRQVLH